VKPTCKVDNFSRAALTWLFQAQDIGRFPCEVLATVDGEKLARHGRAVEKKAKRRADIRGACTAAR
jgi:hypothetical protein